jgi:ABC-type uncharacterized transport system substrate-binding protein
MKRRDFLQLAGGTTIAWPLPALAQQAASLPLVAVTSLLSEQLATARTAQVREGLKQAGLVEAKDYVLTLRTANGDNARLPDIIKELDSLQPRVYVAVVGGVLALHQQLPNAPVVFTARLPQHVIDQVERWAADNEASHSGAIRRLVDLGRRRRGNERVG